MEGSITHRPKMFSQCDKSYRQVSCSEACCGSRWGAQDTTPLGSHRFRKWNLKTRQKNKTPNQDFWKRKYLKTTLGKKRYLLYKTNGKWTENQSIRAEILFNEYPRYERSLQLIRPIEKNYNQNIPKSVAMLKLAPLVQWCARDETGF